MDTFIKKSRIGILAAVMAALLVIYGLTLYKLQIIEGEKYLESSTGTVTTTQNLNASRGSILDRNGVLLVSDRTVYNIKLSRGTLIKQEDPNDILLRLINACSEYGVSYTDTFPVTSSAPFSYDAGASESQADRLSEYFKYFSKSLDPDMSATDLISWMRGHYGIDYTVTAEDARKIIGIRYELEIRVIVNTSDYIFAKNVPSDFVTYISVQDFPGVSVETSSERVYHTTYAAHLLGNIGRVTAEEYAETYKQLGYPLDAYVGKNGVEYAFEEYLHGTNGSQVVYTDSTGAVTDIEVTKEASAGDNVYLTIDIDLQAVAEDSLASTISEMNAEREANNSHIIAEAAARNESVAKSELEELAEGGAVVVLDVNTGDALALASYPTYNLATYSKDYSTLAENPLNPLYNRATLGRYNPGSTFKMVTALAGLRAGIIGRWTQVMDEGQYTKYKDVGFSPRCWIYTGPGSATHGLLDIVGALENSCNYFFYWLSDQMDIDNIAAVARDFGFGSPTGIEVSESSGVLATREYKKEALGEGWWTADTLITAIGQGYNLFTPIQIANYVSTIANGGTHYSTSVLESVASYDYSGILLNKEPEILNVIDDSDGYIDILQEGMRAVAKTGTASSVFKNYRIPVAAKTGTVQSDTASMNTGVFVCYAPANNPEIAIAVVVEKGGSGSALTKIAKDILDAYFTDSEINESIYSDNSSVK